MVSPHVEPVGFHRTADGAIIAEVRQSVRDLDGKPLQGQTHGLKDKTVGHVFRLREGKVARFDIQDAGYRPHFFRPGRPATVRAATIRRTTGSYARLQITRSSGPADRPAGLGRNTRPPAHAGSDRL